MSAATKVSEAKAEAVFEAIRKRFQGWFDVPEDGPKMMRDFDGMDYVVMWEEGPYEWPFYMHGGVLPEMAAAAAEFGFEPKPGDPAKFPKGVMVEPVNHYSVAIYPA